jgi:hypothetical protein
MKEWEEFGIKGDPATQGAPLTIVRHIAHVPTAQRLIEDGEIKAGLVYDESRLNKSRISVTWLSANWWNQGSIYGTVEFQFDWKGLVAGQRIYWVEVIKKYNPPAYRFLLTPGEIKCSDPCRPHRPARRSRRPKRRSPA